MSGMAGPRRLFLAPRIDSDAYYEFATRSEIRIPRD